jgi:hypothetical protein
MNPIRAINLLAALVPVIAQVEKAIATTEDRDLRMALALRLARLEGGMTGLRDKLGIPSPVAID